MDQLELYGILFPERYTFEDAEKWLKKMRPNDDIIYMSFVTNYGIEYVNTLYISLKKIPNDCITAILFDGVEIVYLRCSVCNKFKYAYLRI